MFKKVSFVLIVLCVAAFAISPAVRIKDIARVKEVRDNQLLGFGLVVGLKNTGDTTQAEFTQKALSNMLKKMGVSSAEDDKFKSRNVAGVMVTADLPPFAREGQRIDIRVASIGDATSLKGGNLLMTPLKGADGNTYVVGQGPILVSETKDPLSRKPKTETVGMVIEGGIVEKEIPFELVKDNKIHLLLNDRDFTTAYRIAYSLQRGGISEAKAVDSGTVEIRLGLDDEEDLVSFISRIEDFMVIPDSTAKVVISQRTGTVVIGENVRLAPVAVSHGEIEIVIRQNEENQDLGMFGGEEDQGMSMTPTADEKKLVELKGGSTLRTLVKALNSVGTSPKDVIAILHLLRKSGALTAEIEVI